jgi:hypothetical protein
MSIADGGEAGSHQNWLRAYKDFIDPFTGIS